MTIMQRIGQDVRRAEMTAKATHFADLCRRIMLSRGDIVEALSHASASSKNPASADVLRILKAAVSAGSINLSTWGDEIAEYPGLVAAFLGSLANVSAFDTLLPSMRRVPLRSRAVVVTAGATGNIVDEGSPTPLSKLALLDVKIDPVKALAVIVATRELLQIGDPVTVGLFSNELRIALATVTDAKFLATITDSISATSSTGQTAQSVVQDIDAALQAVRLDASSNLFIVTVPSVARGWTTRVTTTGEFAFPTMSPTGGSIANIPVIVSDGVTAGQFILVDANGIAAASGGIEIDSTTQTSLQFESAPDDPIDENSVMENLWQSNKVALRALRFFGAKRLRDSAVAVISDCTYTEDSPPA
jgi:hypothetical protein